jgi:hypothetical protein
LGTLAGEEVEVDLSRAQVTFDFLDTAGFEAKIEIRDPFADGADSAAPSVVVKKLQILDVHGFAPIESIDDRIERLK